MHHTGDLWNACACAADAVAARGRLLISIYNDQGWRSDYWTQVKRLYCRHAVARPLIIACHLPYLGARVAYRLVTGRTQLVRGMSFWYDYIDWLGGYPFEVASIDAVRRFFALREFALDHVKPATSGCNEFLFSRMETADKVREHYLHA